MAGAHITTLYYVGFSYLMMRRYTDATQAFNTCLVFINRAKGTLSRSANYEQARAHTRAQTNMRSRARERAARSECGFSAIISAWLKRLQLCARGCH